jgi:hypothetical protein
MEPGEATTAPAVNTYTIDKLNAPNIQRIASPNSPLSPAEGTWADQVESSAHK